MGFVRTLVSLLPGYKTWRTRMQPNGGGLAHCTVEKDDENAIQSQGRANMSLADIRDFVRNTSFGQAVLNQLQVNAVGTEGGSLAFATDDEDFNSRVNREWMRYAKSCGFFAGESFNKILRDIVGCLYFNGGDALLVFDNGNLTGGNGTGKILVFESDQIANAPAKYFAEHYARLGYRQERGMIFDKYNRPIGFFASAKRGLEELTLSKDGTPEFLTFIDDHLDLDPLKRPFCFVARTWRPNQGRGVPAVIHVLNELRNLEDLEAAETQAAKLNSHLGLAISDDSSASDMVAASALMAGEKAQAPAIKFDAMLRHQSAILQLPAGKSVQSFDTKRPNDRVIDYIQKVQDLVIAAFGLGRQFYTLTPESSFTAHRGAMQMAWKSIEQIQIDLTSVCEWLASQWFYWRRTANKNAIRVSDEILADIEFAVEWSFPKMPEVDSERHEKTIAAALQNGSLTYRDMKGPEWRRTVKQRSVEREYFRECGETYPGDRMSSGGVTNPEQPTQEEIPENGKE